jgi:alkylation response protein AidB-like acyl-CoA dehydrogenase
VTFRLSPEQAAVRDAVREFGESEIRPVASEYEAEERYPEELRRTAAEYDLVAPHVPEAYGGAGMDAVSTLLVTEELWRADPGVGGAIAAADFGTGMIHDYGEEWMREEWLPRVAGGETPIATCISEPAHGSNVAGMETRARRDRAEQSSAGSAPPEAMQNGDEWVIDGEKTWITNGTVADVAIVMAKTDPDAGHRGITAFLTETDVPGYDASRIDNKLGIRAQDTAEIHLDGLRVPHENVVGEVGEGFYQLMEFFAPARADVAAQATGVATAALEASLDYAREREQFGQPSPSSRRYGTSSPRWPRSSRRAGR